MRSTVDPDTIHRLIKAIGQQASGPGTIYLTGGASALLLGWRQTTVDVDIRLDPEPPGVFQAIAHIKRQMDINVELASPQDFLPPLPGWRTRSVFIATEGSVSFYHYDFTAQALSKLSRGHDRDLSDVTAMYQRGLFSPDRLRECLQAIEPELIRFPSIDPDALKSRVYNFLDSLPEQDDD